MRAYERWANTDLGTPIALFASHTFEELRSLRPLLLIGGVHGDEPLGVHLAQQTLAFLQNDAKKTQPEAQLPWALISQCQKRFCQDGLLAGKIC